MSPDTPSSAAGPRELLEPPGAPRAIVVALDRSKGAERVAAAAVRLSRSLPMAVLHIVHVFRASRLDHAARGLPATPPEIIQEAKEHLESHVATVRRQRRAQVIGHFAVGDPVAEIIRLGSEVKAELIVIGTHDRVGLERWLLGSIAETLARKAPCSVFVVRPDAQAD